MHRHLLYLVFLLQNIAVFDEPKVELEQYPTGPHLASRLLFTVRILANTCTFSNRLSTAAALPLCYL